VPRGTYRSGPVVMVLLSSVSITGSHFKLYCHPISNTVILLYS
jgi:hypothetical protein